MRTEALDVCISTVRNLNRGTYNCKGAPRFSGNMCAPELVNTLTPNDPYSGRTAPLTSKRCILYIYSTNRGTESFKHDIYILRYFLFKMQFVS